MAHIARRGAGAARHHRHGSSLRGARRRFRGHAPQRIRLAHEGRGQGEDGEQARREHISWPAPQAPASLDCTFGDVCKEDARARASHHHFSASASLHNVRSSRVDRLSRTAPGELGDFAYVPDEPFAYAPDEPGRPRGARDRLGDGRARLRGLEDSGALDATLDNRERLARVKTLRKAVRGEALDKGGV